MENNHLISNTTTVDFQHQPRIATSNSLFSQNSPPKSHSSTRPKHGHQMRPSAPDPDASNHQAPQTPDPYVLQPSNHEINTTRGASPSDLSITTCRASLREEQRLRIQKLAWIKLTRGWGPGGETAPPRLVCEPRSLFISTSTLFSSGFIGASLPVRGTDLNLSVYFPDTSISRR